MKQKLLPYFLGLCAPLLMPGNSIAQVPDTFPEDFVVTDINGDTHDIDFILMSGKAVVIDMFWDACPPCWSYHTDGVMDEIHEHLAYAEVFGLEGVTSTPESAISDASSGMGDWTNGGTVPYVLANDDQISTTLNSSSYPTLVLVCPDHSMSEIGQAPFSTWKSAILNCPGLVTSVNENENVAITAVFPNPANNQATVRFNVNDPANGKIEMLNAVGQVVVSENLGLVSGEQNITLNTADIENGMYIVKITVGENIVTKSLSVSK